MDALWERAPSSVCVCRDSEKTSQQNNRRGDGFRHTTEIYQRAEWSY